MVPVRDRVHQLEGYRRGGARVNALLNSLTESELALVRETEPARLALLDEDGLAALHQRVRRARNKYVTLYRRQASSRVSERGARGTARPKGTRDRGKAEVFEEALARVSRSLAVAARASATALKAERLADARQHRNTAPPPAPRGSRAPTAPQRTGRKPDSPALTKRHAVTRAVGARRQTRRDSR